MQTLVIHRSALDPESRDAIAELAGAAPQACRGYLRVDHAAFAPQTVERLRDALGCDVNAVPPGLGSAGLLISDMDSTLITIECIDEIADFAGLKPQVAEITEAAMRGELDFEGSLTRRVALLEGLSESALEEVWRERLRLTPGAEALAAGLKQRGLRFALVSGGFTFFTERLKAQLGLDFTLANTLEVVEGRLTGRVLGEIVGAQVKRRFLLQTAEQLGLTPSQTLAVGDGANDLPMLQASGLGIAFRAKPKVQAQAAAHLNHSGLDAILHLIDAGGR